MSFYWSYTSCPFLCALARRNGARQAKLRKHELTSLLLATNSLSPVTVRYFFVHLWLPWWCEQHGNWKRKTQKWNCKTKPLLLILHGWPQRDSVCMVTTNTKRRGDLIRESEAIPLRYHTRSLPYTIAFSYVYPGFHILLIVQIAWQVTALESTIWTICTPYHSIVIISF